MKTLELDISKVSLGEALVDVKEMIEGDYMEKSREVLQEAFRQAIGLEFDGVVGVERYSRSSKRQNRRNGYRERTLLTQLGEVNISVPRPRQGGFVPDCLERYRRVDRQVEALVREMYLAGVSTRKVRRVLETLCGCGVSAGYVSQVNKTLDKKVREFANSPLADNFAFLYLDGIYVKIKIGIKAQKRVILVAYGVRKDGSRRLISYKLGKQEGTGSWRSFLENLKVRGLKGHNLKLIIMDGAPGLWAAVEEVYPLVAHQLCWVHKLRNVAKYGTRQLRQECVEDAARIMYAGSEGKALKLFRAWRKKWQSKIPKAVACLEKDLDKLLAFFAFEGALHKMLRTTNVIERCFGEVRRRTKPMGGCFQNTASCNRIVFSLFAYFNQNWDRKTEHIKHRFSQQVKPT